MSKCKLSEIDVLQRALADNANDVLPIVEYLKMNKGDLTLSKTSTRLDAKKIASYLRKMGSNSFANVFREEGVPYSEVVYDVAKKLKLKDIGKDDSASYIEGKIIGKLFAEAFDNMSQDEQRNLLQTAGVSENEIPIGSSGTIVMQFLLKRYGGFAVYKTTLIVANIVSRALLGSGLSFATNAALTRVVGAFLGPIGWVATGAWLAIDIAGPAFRKTVPAVVHMAWLRQMVTMNINIGVVGDGSVGKDALFKSVFSIDTDNISPIAGATSETEEYPIGSTGTFKLVNYPGFNDIRKSVNDTTENDLSRTDIFILVIDISRGVSDVDVQSLYKIQSYNKPYIVCLNKIDMVRPRDLESLRQIAKERLNGAELIETAFDPDERIYPDGPYNVDTVFYWLKCELDSQGKDTSELVKVRQI